jgi:hypothetical protein
MRKFILTDLGSLPVALAAYKKRMGIEEMFRDCQTGGYNIEGTGLRGNRLIKRIILMTIADSSAIFQGTEMSEKAGAKICISPKRAEKKVPKTQYIWQGSGWRKVGKLS